MDEPLASLDQARKQEILPYLERLVANARVPILYVSHAREEIDRLAQTVVTIEDGQAKAVGATIGEPQQAAASRVLNLRS
jgi:molybdate transport system ATP-binding protein